MELTGYSETSAHKIQTQGESPERKNTIINLSYTPVSHNTQSICIA